MYAFRIVNVFTVDGDRFSGNPLCVFDDARGLTDAQMQALARQFNLSETTFVLPSDKADFRVRIFTPGFEMPFAGHPTLGTASVVAKGEKVTFEMKAGLVPVTKSDGEWTLKTARGPEVREVEATRVQLAQMLALPEDAIAGEPLWVNTGSEQLVIPLAGTEYVDAAAPRYELMERFATSPAREEAMAYVWAGDQVRFFFTLNGGVVEDPATGSACANLGGWHVAQKRAPVALTLHQGAAVGRPSRLRLRVDDAGGIFVTGAVIELGRGQIDL